MRIPSIIVTLAAAAIAVTAAPAFAGSNTTTITTQDGRTFTREATRSGPARDRSGTVRWTGPDGRVTERNFRRTYDSAGGFTREGSVTGSNGRRATLRRRARCSGGACERTVERQGFAGRRSTVRGSGQRVAPGVFEGRRSVTGPRGRTRGFGWRRVRR